METDLILKLSVISSIDCQMAFLFNLKAVNASKQYDIGEKTILDETKQTTLKMLFVWPTVSIPWTKWI